MSKKCFSLSRRNGFTLVEMVVVLAIMAVLMTMLVPSLTGYVDRARSQTVVAETRSVVMAAQTVISEDYAAGVDVTAADYAARTDVKQEILTLAEADGEITSMTIQGSGSADAVPGRLLSLTYTGDNDISCTYTYAAEEYNRDPYEITTAS